MSNNVQLYIGDCLDVMKDIPDHSVDMVLCDLPYKLSLEFVQKSLSVLKDGDKCLMFMRIQFLEGKQRYGFFQDNPPKYVYVHSTRQSCAKNGEFERSDGKDNVSVMCFCWYLWEKGYHGETALRWIP